MILLILLTFPRWLLFPKETILDINRKRPAFLQMKKRPDFQWNLQVKFFCIQGKYVSIFLKSNINSILLCICRQQWMAFIIVKIQNTKLTFSSHSLSQTWKMKKIYYSENFHKYIKLWPDHSKFPHLFLNYQNGKCCLRVVGKGTIGKSPWKIPEY